MFFLFRNVEKYCFIEIGRLPKEHQGGATMLFCRLDTTLILVSQLSLALLYELLVNITMFSLDKFVHAENKYSC